LPAVSDEWLRSASRAIPPARIDTSAPNPARVWDALNGGRDNFEADRRVARHLVDASPPLEQAGLAGWAFRMRAARSAREAGIRQFLDISMGMRTLPATQSLAQGAGPGCHLVFVASDPVVLSHLRATLRSPIPASVSCVDADPLDPTSALRAASGVLDLAEPVAVIMPDTLSFTADASAAVAALVAGLPSGSYLAVIQAAEDERLAPAARRWNRIYPMPVYLRHAGEVAGWFQGCDILEPGVVEVHRWRPSPDDPDCPAGMPLLGAVARKR
jgi:hypothetical protein